jgi:predicted PurR-regulated permease PerM
MRMKYWGIAAAIFLVLLWYLGDVLMPFVLGGAIAYFLDPVADRLERAGASRTLATGIIAGLSAIVLIAMMLVVIPTLVAQTSSLVQVAPQLVRDLQEHVADRFPHLMEADSTARQALDSLALTVKARGGDLLNAAISSTASVFGILMLFVIVPVVAVYMLLDWDRMVAKVDTLLPREHAPVIRRLAKDIDATLSSFIRGMGTVCLSLGVYYAIGLMAVGLQFGLVVGVIAGLLTFIPYVGAIFGGGLAIGLALFQFWGEWHWVAAVASIFAVGQVIEGNVLTPKLVGGSVGLHPVWLMLALSVFGSLFGFVGMLVAVPVAAALGVVARFGMEKYTESKLYTGERDTLSAQTQGK